MYTINNSMLTLILRFAGRKQDIAFSNQEFIQKQLQAIQGYVDKYPPEEKKMRTIEWIAMCAREYREAWEKESICKEVSSHRCPDCPLSDSGDLEHCQIHEQWVRLIEQYSAHEMNSRTYVESALELLAQNKEHLKIKQGTLEVRGVG
jgi:hypothetical protein